MKIHVLVHRFRLATAFVRFIGTVLVGSVTLVGSVDAAFLTFDNGSGDGDWHNRFNWSGNGVPTLNDYAEIEAGHVVSLSTAGNQADYIDVLGNAVLNILGGDVTFGGGNNRYFWVGFGSAGTVNQSAGTVTGNGNNTDIVVDTQGVYNMSGGSIVLSDDFWLLNGGQLNISGAPTISVADDFGVPANASATINIVLTGTQAPLITVGDDVRLQDGVLLNIDTSQWDGDDTVQLFEVGDRSIGGFQQVVVDGQVLAPSDYGFFGSQFMVLVPEPATWLALGGTLCGFLGLARSRQTTATAART